MLQRYLWLALIRFTIYGRYRLKRVWNLALALSFCFILRKFLNNLKIYIRQKLKVYVFSCQENEKTLLNCFPWIFLVLTPCKVMVRIWHSPVLGHKLLDLRINLFKISINDCYIFTKNWSNLPRLKHCSCTMSSLG